MSAVETDITPYVTRLFIHPIKSLDPVPLETVTLLKSGAMQSDREFALFDAAGHVVNGKRHPRIHALRSNIDLEQQIVTLWVQGATAMQTFHFQRERSDLVAWLSDYFGFPVTLQQNLDMGFPDDTASPGPTIISTATLEIIASWYPNLDVTDIRARFRSNIEIAGVPAFWEDQLFGQADHPVAFQIGTVNVLGINPCQRCVVVTRHPQTGEPSPNFQKTFVAQRQATLPAWADTSRFNHFYRLAVNTRLPATEAGKTIQIGDRLQILGVRAG
jgi:uncharacterized protein